MTTVVELHYDKHNAALREFLGKAVETAKKHPNGDRFLTYRPLHGGGEVVYVLFRSAGASALEESLGKDAAVALAEAARSGVKACAHHAYESTDSHGDHSDPAPYLFVVGMDKHPAGANGGKAAADALRAANKAHEAPVPYNVLKPAAGAAPDLMLFPLQSLADLEDGGTHNEPRLAKHVGHEKGTELAAALKHRPHSRAILRYVPELSNP